MSESTETAVPESNPGESNDSPDLEPLDVDSKAPDAVRESAKYRKRAQDAEAERDRLIERLSTLQRAEAQRLASEHLADGADLWRDGAELAAMLNDDGDVDADKVTEAAKALVAAHGHWRKPAQSAPPPASTVTANDKIAGPEEPTAGWTDLLNSSKREALQNRQ